MSDSELPGQFAISSQVLEPAQISLKVLMIGSSAVGKTSLMLRYTEEATVGVDVKVKRLDMDGKQYRLAIWDTAGQERFRTLTSSYYRNAQGVILIYDITSRASFEALEHWLQELETYEMRGIEAVRLIVGNKIDSVAQRVISTQEGQTFARDNNALFLETSAKSDRNVDEMFRQLVIAITARPELYAVEKTADVDLSRDEVEAVPSCAC